VIEALRLINETRKGQSFEKTQYFMSIANCGFPEAQRNANAQAFCKLFSASSGYIASLEAMAGKAGQKSSVCKRP
jgi:hypothetical protein